MKFLNRDFITFLRELEACLELEIPWKFCIAYIGGIKLQVNFPLTGKTFLFFCTSNTAAVKTLSFRKISHPRRSSIGCQLFGQRLVAKKAEESSKTDARVLKVAQKVNLRS